jgi:lipocalin
VNVSNICNKDSPDGKLIVANETLSSSMKPSNGRYNATFLPGLPVASYNIIVLKTDDYSVEYDCIRELGITNYCVHILSRKTTLDTAMVNNILKYVQELGLNTAKLDYVQTKQENCAYFK